LIGYICVGYFLLDNCNKSAVCVTSFYQCMFVNILLNVTGYTWTEHLHIYARNHEHTLDPILS